MGSKTRPLPADPEAKAGHAADDLRQATREAHEAIQAMRTTRRELLALRDELRGYVKNGLPQAAADMVKAAIKPVLEEFGTAMNEHQGELERRASARLDRFIAAVLGEDDPSGSLEEALKRFLGRQRMFAAQAPRAVGGRRVRSLTFEVGHIIECPAGQRMELARDDDGSRLRHADHTECDHPGEPASVPDPDVTR